MMIILNNLCVPYPVCSFFNDNFCIDLFFSILLLLLKDQLDIIGSIMTQLNPPNIDETKVKFYF